MNEKRFRREPACRELCAVLSRLPGVTVLESTHGPAGLTFGIWLRLDTTEVGAVVLSRVLSGRYYSYEPTELRSDPVWTLALGDTDIGVAFHLKAKGSAAGPGSFYAPAEGLALNILSCLESPTFMDWAQTQRPPTHGPEAAWER